MTARLSRPALRSTGMTFALCLSSLSLLNAQQSTTPTPPVATSTSTTPATTPSPQVATDKTPTEETALSAQLAAIADGDEASSANKEAGPLGVIPLTKGFNLSLATASQHDSAGGWSNVLSPTIAYRFDKHFNISATVSTFPYINVVTTTQKKNLLGVVTKTTTALETEHFLLSDTTLNGAFDAHTNWLDYNLTATLGLPTGDDAAGLGAGQVTYGFVNHFERPLGDYFTPDIEIGIDDDPNLLTPRIRKSYIVVGKSAHFQAGVAVDLPFNMNFETDAYEELPIGSVTVTSTTTKGKKGKQLTTSTQESAGEDNGFTNELDIPLNPHIALSGFYNRSLRNHDDTAGFTLTFLLRGNAKEQATK